jgi:RNase P subunit RPR2
MRRVILDESKRVQVILACEKCKRVATFDHVEVKRNEELSLFDVTFTCPLCGKKTKATLKITV